MLIITFRLLLSKSLDCYKTSWSLLSLMIGQKQNLFFQIRLLYLVRKDRDRQKKLIAPSLKIYKISVASQFFSAF